MRVFLLFPMPLLLLLSAAVLLWTPAADASLRCGSRLVDDGDSRLRVKAACGEPDFVDHAAYSNLGGEVWYYNFGSAKLLRVITFRNGRVSEIESDGYGFPDNHRVRVPACDGFDIVPGLTKYRLVSRCGLPDDRHTVVVLDRFDKRHRRGARGRFSNPLVEIVREEWTYNFGPSALIRHAWLENGVVVRTEFGERGF